MGLDITYYRNLVKANENEAFDEHGELRDDDGWFQAYVNPDFPGRADEIESGIAYRGECAGSFCAGSYSGYNGWRNELAKIAGYPEQDNGRTDWHQHTGHDVGAWMADGGPFWELINFSDCEGDIGASVSAKLAADFKAFQGAADNHSSGHFREKYAEWQKAFEAAADNGCVRFR